ncbi:Pycsar system effector family protein [Mesorhizobium kowhaii]|uniref:Pycsar system effector family protein n=1 Tax=Mesorhizobium kowhaii TaxID=1300272 RepID=UPI0035E8448C
MARDDQQDSYDKLLSASHGRMLDLVKFAETKNAALLTFCSVWMGSIIAILRSPDEPPMGYRAAFLVVLPLLAVAALISLTSFLPKFLHHFHQNVGGATNLLYFGDIAELAPEEFGGAARKRYFPKEDQSATDDYLDDLALQVAVQARIANRKFRTFNAAGRLVLASFVCLAVPPIVWALQTIWRTAQTFIHAAS